MKIKYKLLKPIISRFCEIFIGEPIINKKFSNLHKYNLYKIYNFDKEKKKREIGLQKILNQAKDLKYENIEKLAIKIYEKSYSALDIMKYIEKYHIEEEKKYQMLICFTKIRKEFRNEKILIMFILNFLFLRSDYNLENISFM